MLLLAPLLCNTCLMSVSDSNNNDETDTEKLVTPSPRSEIVEGRLTPRHRRFAQLLASQACDLKELSKQTGYSYDTCKGLAKDPEILKEVYRLQDYIFEESVKVGLKSMKQSALDHIRFIMTDDTGRVKSVEKTAVAQWIVEKLDGKATQTHDVGENTLSLLLDKLDAQKALPQAPPRDVSALPNIELAPAKPRTEEDDLDDWVRDLD